MLLGSCKKEIYYFGFNLMVFFMVQNHPPTCYDLTLVMRPTNRHGRLLSVDTDVEGQ